VRARRSRIIEETDERSPRVRAALALIESTFERPDRQSVAELRSELEEKRLGLLSAYDFHMLTAAEPAGSRAAPGTAGRSDERAENVLGTIVGAYLEGVNSGFITLLAVRPESRGRRVAQRLRATLFEAFRANARNAGHDDLDFVLGEVRSASPWLKRLLRTGAIAIDVTYYHPGMSPRADGPEFTLYAQPVGGTAADLDTDRVRRTIYAIYRRAYRVRYPLERPGFRSMLEELASRSGD
jgi:ribosomal protein S18 acetylase RimI-like enzyme